MQPVTPIAPLVLRNQAPLLLDALRATCEAVEVYQASSDSVEVRFTAGAVKTATARESSGVAVRAIRGGRLGFAGSRDVSPRGFERLLGHVESSLAVGDATKVTFPGPCPPPATPEALGLCDGATASLGVPDLVALGAAAVALVRERHPGVVVDAVVRRTLARAALVNTAGAQVTEEAAAVSLGLEANRTREDDVLLDSAYAVARSGLDPLSVARELVTRLDWAARDATLAPGRLPVLFSPHGSLVLWGPLLEALSGKNVMLGTSPLRERLGEVVLDARVDVTDDGLLPGGLGSSPFDDEGTPRARRALVARGAVAGFMHDLETAAATGAAPTGNGARGGVLARPAPSTSNVVVAGGERTRDELLASIDRGLLVCSVIGMGQGNTLPGTFSNPIDLAFLVERGQVVGRVKDLSIAGNVYELLAGQLAGLSREVEPVYGSFRLPWLLLDGVSVAGKGRDGSAGEAHQA